MCDQVGLEARLLLGQTLWALPAAQKWSNPVLCGLWPRGYIASPCRCHFCSCSLGLFVRSQAPSRLLFSSTLFPKGSIQVEVLFGWQNLLQEEPHGRKLGQWGSCPRRGCGGISFSLCSQLLHSSILRASSCRLLHSPHGFRHERFQSHSLGSYGLKPLKSRPRV